MYFKYTPCALTLSALHLSHSDAPSRVKRLAEVLGSASGVYLQGGERVAEVDPSKKHVRITRILTCFICKVWAAKPFCDFVCFACELLIRVCL